jgi:hypothetical protein
MEGSQSTATNVSPAALQFGYLAGSLAQLLEVVRREFEHDREAAKASLATASTILQSEIERHSGALHRQEPAPEYSHPGPQRRRAAHPGALLAVVQADLRRTATCLRGQEALGESLPSDANQFRFAERNRAERWIFGSGTSVQTIQASLWAKSGQLAARPRDTAVSS